MRGKNDVIQYKYTTKITQFSALIHREITNYESMKFDSTVRFLSYETTKRYFASILHTSIVHFTVTLST